MPASSGPVPISCAPTASLFKLPQGCWRVAHPTCGLLDWLPCACLLAVLALVAYNSPCTAVTQKILDLWQSPGRGRRSWVLVQEIRPGSELALIDLAAKSMLQFPFGLATPALLICPPKPGRVE